MFGAYSALVLLLVGAAVIGQALLSFARGFERGQGEGFDWLAPAVGIAAMLVLAGIAARLPGHALTAAIALVAAAIASLVYLRGRVRPSRSDLALVAAVVLVTTIAASLPFALVGNVGVLGAGLVNDDMASHLLIADYVRDPGGFVPSFIRGGYPIGPHSVVVAIAELNRADLVDVFSGFTVALAPLLGLAALAPLRELSWGRRAIGACMVGLAYLSASFLVSGAFKEPLMSLIVLTFALLLARLLAEAFDPKVPARRVNPLRGILPLAVLAAAAVFNYSLPGLLWIGAVGGSVIAVRWFAVRPRPQLPSDWRRRVAPYLLGGLLILVVATAQEWSRIADFARLEALNPDRFGSDQGNLVNGAISPLEALGIWPTGDYRSSASSAGFPALVFYAGAVLAAFGLIQGIRWAASRRLYAPVAALGAIVLVWGVTAIFSTPYIAAKALAIAAPVVMLLAVGGLLARGGGGSNDAMKSAPATAFSSLGPARALIAVAFVLAAAVSSFLALRQAPVRPEAHSEELAKVREVVQDEPVLFLGRDDFIGYELRGSGEITGIVTNFYSVEEVRGRFQKGEGGGEKFDLDAVFPSTLDDFRYILATTGGPSSSPPPRLNPVVETENFVLYERRGLVGKRKTLDEGVEPGAVLECPRDEPRPEAAGGKGTAQIWTTQPVVGGPRGWDPTADPTDAQPTSYELTVPAGRSLISLEYDSRRPLRVSSPELGLDAELPANLAFRGPSPFFPIGEVEVEQRTEATATVEVAEPNLLARLLRAPNEAHLRSISATPLGVIERIQRRQSCGKYVDWYRAR